MLNASQATFATTKAFIDETRPSANREANRLSTAHIHIKSEFLAYIKAEYGAGYSEKIATRIAEKAREDGHASGFDSVESAAIHCAELAKNNSATLWVG